MDISRNKDIDTSMMMDETEDEEVKRSCFGMKHYESSSDEDSDCESVDVDSGSPIKFRCGKPSRSDVLKPTPLTLQRIIEKKSAASLKPSHGIIHNECEFSGDENASSDEDQEEDVSFNPSRESSFQGVFQKAKPENDDDTCSDATEEDFLSEYENDENSFDGGETSNQDEVEAEDEDDQEDSRNGEDGSVSSNSGASSISSDDSNDESSDDEELEQDVSADQEDSEEQVKKVIVDWGDVSSDNHSTDVISRVASDADENDNDSMSAEEIEDLIRKPQASDMNFSDSEDTTVDTTEDDYDLMKCFMNPDEEKSESNIQPLKRVLSSQNVVVCHDESDVESEGTKGNFTGTEESAKKIRRKDDNGPPIFPCLYPGQTSFCSRFSLNSRYGEHEYRDVGRHSPEFSASTAEEVVDNQLAEELIDNMLSDKMPPTTPEERDPVPLLTPPSTPIVPYTCSNGQVAVCEWPSNLTVDNALTAAFSMRPLSPSSLLRLEEQSNCKEELLSSPPPTTYLSKRLRSVSEEISSGLTPRLHVMLTDLKGPKH